MPHANPRNRPIFRAIPLKAPLNHRPVVGLCRQTRGIRLRGFDKTIPEASGSIKEQADLTQTVPEDQLTPETVEWRA